jgi:hypothetical protein
MGAQGLDEFPTQSGKRLRMQENHTLVFEVDLAVSEAQFHWQFQELVKIEVRAH